LPLWPILLFNLFSSYPENGSKARYITSRQTLTLACRSFYLRQRSPKRNAGIAQADGGLLVLRDSVACFPVASRFLERDDKRGHRASQQTYGGRKTMI